MSRGLRKAIVASRVATSRARREIHSPFRRVIGVNRRAKEYRSLIISSVARYALRNGASSSTPPLSCRAIGERNAQIARRTSRDTLERAELLPA